MADYKGIKGFTIQTIAGDPPAPIVGQVWYNTTSNVLKGYVSGTGAWAAANDMNLARAENAGAKSGTVTAALAFGGDAPPSTTPPGYTAETEEYDGTSWSEVSNLTSVRAAMGSLGTQTAAMCISGNHPSPPNPNLSEIYNGTSWSEVAETQTRRTYVGGAGTITAGLAAGGSGTISNESWNGSSWSEEADLNTVRDGSGSAGTVNTAALVMGGSPPGGLVVTEQWNGTSWSEVGDLNSGRGGFAASFGTSTSAIAAGGHTGPTPSRSLLTEKWDGTSWTEVGALAVAMRLGAGGGTSSAGMRADGHPGAGGYSLTSSEWADPYVAVKTFTSS